MKIIDGKKVSSQIKGMIAKRIEENYLSLGKQVPTLACVLVGENPASKIYVANKERACKLVGINSVIKNLPETSTEQEVADLIEDLNNNPNISGILLQLPLPKHLNESRLVNLISPQKDVDGLTELSLGKLISNNQMIAPCTATGVMDLLANYNVEIEGKYAVVIGRSLLVGKSVANLLEQQNATVTICHSKTTNLKEITKQADILVVAIGKPKFITGDMVKKGAVVIDVGINRTEAGIVGDVDFQSVSANASLITPVPGGVGPMTIAELMRNTLILHENDKKNNSTFEY